MTPDEIASQFDDRPGYNLVQFGEVGLPVYVVSAVALIQQYKPLLVVEDFTLQSLSVGLTTQALIAKFLGLDEEIVRKALVELIRQEFVRMRGPRDFELTAQGKVAVVESRTLKPAETMIQFTYDGLIREPRLYEAAELYSPRNLSDAGFAEIPAIPNRGPDEGELNVLDVEKSLAGSNHRRGIDGKLLKIKRVERRARMFVPAVALVFKAEVGGDFRVGFAINGRLSHEHEVAFGKINGVERISIFRDLHSEIKPPKLDEVIGDDLARKLPVSGQIHRAYRDLVNAKATLQRARRSLEITNGEPDPKALAVVETAKENLEKSKDVLDEYPVRPLPVYEHPVLLRKSLIETQSRLLIISPWIRRAVIDNEFLSSLEKLLARNVLVHIGYGLGEEDKDARPADKEVIRKLQAFSSTHHNFVFKRLGNTHAKVLIKDSEFFVISSFNWLSFRGDPDRTFREEWGTLVEVPASVDGFYEQMRARISENEGKD